MTVAFPASNVPVQLPLYFDLSEHDDNPRKWYAQVCYVCFDCMLHHHLWRKEYASIQHGMQVNGKSLNFFLLPNPGQVENSTGRRGFAIGYARMNGMNRVVISATLNDRLMIQLNSTHIFWMICLVVERSRNDHVIICLIISATLNEYLMIKLN